MSGHSYETLPDLLSDVKKMAFAVNFDDLEPFDGGWEATITCGGNYHKLDFMSYLGCYLGGNSNKEFMLNDDEDGFPDMDSLNVELNHVRDFISNEQLTNNTKLSYNIAANGGKPHLKIFVVGSYDKPTRIIPTDEETNCGRENLLRDILPDRYSARQLLHTAIIVPLVAIPTILIMKKLKLGLMVDITNPIFMYSL